MEKIIKFGDIEIQEAKKFHQHKETISIKNIDINKIVVSYKVSFIKKDLNTLLVAKVLKKRPLCIFLPKMRVYRKAFDETKYMSFLIKDNELLEKYNEIWKKLENIIKKEFDSEPVYNEKYLKGKIKLHNVKIKTNFHNNKIPRERSQFICLSVNVIDSVFRKGKNYYSQALSEEFKYVAKEKKIPKNIIDDIEISSDSEKISRKS